MVGGGSPRFFKDTGSFIVHPGGALESRLELQSGSITPNRLFYVLHNGERAVDVDASTWRLRVEGDAVERPLTVTYEDIRGMPSRSLVCYLECAGNHRAMFDLLRGRPAGSPPWGTGAVGNAEWTGVPLAHVLAEAGYVLIGEDYPAEGPAMGRPITTLVINSALALAWPAELHAGAHLIGGYARSPHGAVTAVEWSADSGATWSPAEIEPPQSRYSSTPFTFRWTAEPGEHTLTTRATDAAGNTQPDTIPHNTRGYLFNQPLPHPIRVT